MPNFVVREGALGRREKLLLSKLEEQYTDSLLREILLPIVTNESPVSLRALDWAVVNFTKKNNILCSSPVPGRMTNIHDSYRNTLSFWKRRLFDPFRRRSRVGVLIEGREYDTTLGQANFTLWAYKTGVLSYVLGHIDAIEADMNRTSRRNRCAKRDAGKGAGKRKQLTASQPLTCVAYLSSSTSSFE